MAVDGTHFDVVAAETLRCRVAAKQGNAARRSVAAGLAVVWIAGCGYSADREKPFKTRNAKDQPIRSVAIDVFESKEFRRGLELQLTEALKKRMAAETPYRLVKKDRADSVLSGEVKEVRQSTIGRDFRSVLPRETTATMVVSFQWKDLRNGEILVDRPNFVQTVDYIRPLGEDFYHASQRSVDRMAERIVETMEADW